MDIRQLEFFIAVAREENFTRAAETVYVTQSGLSASIRALERDLGVQLFDRGSYGARLTRSGEIFLPRARRILEDARAVRQELVDDEGNFPRVVRVGSEQCLGDLVDVVDLLAAFRASGPGVDVSYVQAGSEELRAHLSAAELDLAIIARRGASEASEGERPSLLRREPFLLVAPADHALSALAEVSWSEAVASAEFVDFQPAWTVRRILDAATRERGLQRRSAVSVDDVHMLLEMVERGFGVAALPRSLAFKDAAAGLSKIALSDPDIAWEVHVEVAPEADNTARGLQAMLLPDALLRRERHSLASLEVAD
ncbi:LysR family transcriptional regulator [Demequina sp. NBRC 110052]|uniref:LysR family transcriptional regulator n=1 Tax=Demequina sp. NBRC 110052 TaxID=1570341 RepID=UPI0009FD82C0|nr:LysR family transcriptional regulator [Demequina sp. NBRC 110052]